MIHRRKNARAQLLKTCWPAARVNPKPAPPGALNPEELQCDVVVYAQGGVGDRGGAYRVTDSTGATLRDYIKVNGPTAPTGFTQVAPDPNNYVTGNVIVFTNLKASAITIEGTTDGGLGSGGTPRAPINAIQLVSPAGLLVTSVKPTLTISSLNGVVTITFSGTLQSSTTVNGTFTPVAGATTSPYTVPTGSAPTMFFRAKQ